jgi:hypothetical protein
MVTTVQINAICEAVLTAFNDDPKLWSEFLVRGKLGTELEQIRSEIRQREAEHNTETADYTDDMQTLTLAEQAKLAEIDAL